MSRGVNKVFLLGNLGADPELRYTQTGTAVLNLRLATTTYAGQEDDGSAKEHTEWHNVVVWGNRADALGKILSKGSTLHVEGEIRTRSYEKDGDKKYSTEIHAREVTLCGGRDDESRGREQGAGGGNRGGGARGGKTARGGKPQAGGWD